MIWPLLDEEGIEEFRDISLANLDLEHNQGDAKIHGVRPLQDSVRLEELKLDSLPEASSHGDY